MTLTATTGTSGTNLRLYSRRYAMFIALLVIAGVFTFATGGVFLSLRNLSNLTLQTSSVTILAMGMVLIIVSGHIDLSVGSFVGAVGAAIGWLQIFQGAGTPLSIFIALALGLGIGVWQGYWIAYRRIPSIIVTLASMLMLRAAAIAFTRGQSLGPLEPAFLAISQTYLPQLGIFKNDSTVLVGLITFAVVAFSLYRTRQKPVRSRVLRTYRLADAIPRLLSMAMIIAVTVVLTGYRGMPIALLVVSSVGIGLWFLGSRTVFGRQIYAIGGNSEAARFSGVNVRLRVFTLFVIMGVVSAIAAIVFTARVGSATAAAGSVMELDAIAAAIIGGTSLAGGKGTIAGAIVGALVMASLDNGMSLLNLDGSFQMFVKGMILLLAVWFDTSQGSKAKL